MTLYIGNLPFSSTEEEIRTLFEPFGTVSDVKLITDHETGKSKGYAFVELLGNGSEDDIIEKLDNSEFGGRNIRVNHARRKKTMPKQSY